MADKYSGGSFAIAACMLIWFTSEEGTLALGLRSIATSDPGMGKFHTCRGPAASTDFVDLSSNLICGELADGVDAWGTALSSIRPSDIRPDEDCLITPVEWLEEDCLLNPPGGGPLNRGVVRNGA